MRERWGKKGITCLCCDQLAKVYRRPLGSTIAKVLVRLCEYRDQRGDEWANMPELLSQLAKMNAIPDTAARGGDYAKLQLWGLITAKTGFRDDGSPRNGFFRITEHGVSFVLGETRVPKYAFVYGANENLLGFDEEHLVTISDCMRFPFNYREILETGWQTITGRNTSSRRRGRSSSPSSPTP